MDFDADAFKAVVPERHSVRKYTGQPIAPDAASALRDFLAACSSESGLDMMLVEDDPSAFRKLKAKITGISDVPAYIAIAGPADDPPLERAGYYGEAAVLLAQTLGLNTCWAMSCSPEHVNKLLPEGRRMIIGIAVGYGKDPGKPHKNKPLEKIADTDGMSVWFNKGIAAVMDAPTALNRQAFRFSYEGGKVDAVNTGGRINRIDLGIARFHFELGAGAERFEWAHPI